jgi:SAM-dependent methyltransferase/glycosyltransferase involved in cell wall biosynthesis
MRVADASRLQAQLEAQHRTAAELHAQLATYHSALTASRAELGSVRGELTETLRAVEQGRAELFHARERDRRREAMHRAALQHLAPRSALRVLYVADRTEAPYRYRCQHAVEQLRDAGVVANAMLVGDPDLLDVIPSYSIVVLFRLPWTPRVETILGHARCHHASVIFESDDLIFDPAVEPLIPFLANFPPALQQDYLERFARCRQTFDACDYFIGSTPALARHAERLGLEGFVHPNLVSPAYVRASRVLRVARRFVSGPPVIAYLSGSNTHDRDLASIGGALARVLDQDRAARLLVCGFVTLPPELDTFAGRVTHLTYQDWRAYPWALVRCRVSLAPAAVRNDFTDAKSALKFFESGILEVPTVATPTEAFRDAIRDGENGFLAENEGEWVEKIRLALDPERGAAVGARARTTVLERFSFPAHRGNLEALLRPLVGHAPGPQPSLRPIPAGDPPRPAGRRERIRARWTLTRRQVDLLRDRVPSQEISFPPWLPSLDPAAFDAALTQDAEANTFHLLPDWTPLNGLERRADGEWESLASDPILVASPLELESLDFRYLVVRMAATSHALPAMAQCFWLPDDVPGFVEGHSVCWPLEVDGRPHTYVLDLAQTRWRYTRRIRALRLDPLASAGSVRLERVALAREVSSFGARGDVRAALAARHIHGVGVECGALQNPLAVPADARVIYIDRLTEPQAREHYPELAGQQLVFPAVVGDLHRLPLRDASVDYCIGNHLLEHVRDPIGALENLLRVVRPGGVVFVSVPDVGNPLDRGRPVTPFTHLLEDHDAGRDRSAEDLGHYRESAASSHREMDLDARARLVDAWVAQRYSVHFHTFDEASYRAFLEHVCHETGTRLAEFVRNRQDDFDEYIAILRRPGSLAPSSGTPAEQLPHYGRWWYPLYRPIARFVPPALRRRARARVEQRR